MNIAHREATFGNRHQLQQLLTACVALLAISVAVAVGLTNDWGSSKSTPAPVKAGPAQTSASEAPQSYIYVVNSAEQRDMIAQVEGNLLTAIAASNPNQPLRHSTIVDVSTPEGQQMLEAINGDLAAAAYSGSQFFPQVISLVQ